MDGWGCVCACVWSWGSVRLAGVRGEAFWPYQQSSNSSSSRYHAVHTGCSTGRYMLATAMRASIHTYVSTDMVAVEACPGELAPAAA